VGETELVIETSGLTRRYGERVAVDRLDLSVPARTVTGFVGPNGAGKTTTIRILLGLIRATSGTGRVLGHPLHEREAYLPEVGAMVDGPALYPQLSARANLLVLARLAGSRDGIEPALEVTGLRERADDQVGSYSLGMRQRLGIAAALLTRPRLLILDEPTNGLDPAGVVEIRALLRRLANDGTSVFVSSHQLTELQHVCTHLVLLRDGKLVYQGPLDALLARQPTRIVVRPETDHDLDALVDLVDMQGWTTDIGGGVVVVTGPDVGAATLNRIAHAHGIVLDELWRRQPSLEETFFALTSASDQEGAA
jgi:ABC-2 type transport system ATP-binding protein